MAAELRVRLTDGTTRVLGGFNSSEPVNIAAQRFGEAWAHDGDDMILSGSLIRQNEMGERDGFPDGPVWLLIPGRVIVQIEFVGFAPPADPPPRPEYDG